MKRPHEVSAFFAPSLIAGKFKANDFVTTYLRPGSASSSTDFLYLLDELNAYTHDLNTAIALSRSRAPVEQGADEIDHRDGLAALMAFVALYVERAEESEPATWSGLLQPRVAKTVSELWGRAEKVMASSCGIPNFGTQDKPLIRQFCQSRPQASLQKILGRAPVCPTACLKSTPVAARESKPLRGHDADRQCAPQSRGESLSSVLEPRDQRPRRGQAVAKRAAARSAAYSSIAAALRPEIDDAARHVMPGRQHLRHVPMDRVHHADEPGVDARHLANVDDRLDPGHMDDRLDALQYLVRCTSR